MANSHLTSGERLQIYEAIFRLNRSFHLIVCRLSELGKFRSFNPRTLADLRGLIREMQVEINHHLISKLNTIEAEDWYTFGKVRIRRDKRLKK
jgi:hypothetical protein